MVFSFVIFQFLFGVPIFSQSIRMSMLGQTNDPILYLNVENPSLSIKFLWLTTTPQHQEAAVHNTCRWLFHHKHSWPYHFYEMHLSVFLKVSTLIRLSAFFFWRYFSSSLLHPRSITCAISSVVSRSSNHRTLTLRVCSLTCSLTVPSPGWKYSDERKQNYWLSFENIPHWYHFNFLNCYLIWGFSVTCLDVLLSPFDCSSCFVVVRQNFIELSWFTGTPFKPRLTRGYQSFTLSWKYGCSRSHLYLPGLLNDSHIKISTIVLTTFVFSFSVVVELWELHIIHLDTLCLQTYWCLIKAHITTSSVEHFLLLTA